MIPWRALLPFWCLPWIPYFQILVPQYLMIPKARCGTVPWIPFKQILLGTGIKFYSIQPKFHRHQKGTVLKFEKYGIQAKWYPAVWTPSSWANDFKFELKLGIGLETNKSKDECRAHLGAELFWKVCLDTTCADTFIKICVLKNCHRFTISERVNVPSEFPLWLRVFCPKVESHLEQATAPIFSQNSAFWCW